MSYPRLRISGVGPTDPHTLEADPGPPRPPADLDQSCADGANLVILWGHDAAAHPELPAVVAALRARGASVGLAGPAHRLVDHPEVLGLVDVVWVPLHGDASVHDALLGEGDAAAVQRVLASSARVRGHVTVVDADDAPARVADAVATLGPTVEAVEVHRHGAMSWGRRRAVLDALWEALRGCEVRLTLHGLDTPADHATAPARPLDASLVAIREQGGWLPGLGGGVTSPETLSGATRRALHALGMPAEGAPVPHPVGDLRGPVVIVVPFLGDTLLATATLPALARALHARGVAVRLQSVWDPPWNLYGPGAFEPDEPVPVYGDETDPARAAKRLETAKRFSAKFLQRLDLSDAATVIAPGLDHGLTVWTHPTLPADATVHVLDLHLTTGLDAWHRRWLAPGTQAQDGTWWPDPDGRLRIGSCFPGFLANYRRQGVPMQALRFAPYPVDTTAFGPGVPVLRAEHLATAGNHRRDHGLLTEVAAHLPAGTRPIHWHTSADPGEVPAPLTPCGFATLGALHRTLQGSRAVLLPLDWSPTDAAGISLAALSLAAGRPIVASMAWGMADHLVHGVDALLVPPGDARATAEALSALDRDDALATRLAAGATTTGAALSADTLAARLCGEPVPPWPRRPFVRGEPDAG